MTRSMTAVLAMAMLLVVASGAEAQNRLIRFFQEPEQLELPAPRTTEQEELEAPSFDPPAEGALSEPLQKAKPLQKGHSARRIRYVEHCLFKDPHAKAKSIYETVLSIPDPQTGGVIDVPVRLPGYCIGKPAVHSRPGLFGRGITKFHWRCGYRVRVVVNAHGDVIVHYFPS